VRKIVAPVAWKTASNEAVKFELRSLPVRDRCSLPAGAREVHDARFARSRSWPLRPEAKLRCRLPALHPV
jgi:hypothetical protein